MNSFKDRVVLERRFLLGLVGFTGRLESCPRICASSWAATRWGPSDVEALVVLGGRGGMVRRPKQAHKHTVDSTKLECGCRMVCAGVPSFFGFGLEDGHVPMFWLSP